MGPAGTPPHPNNWNIITGDKNDNNEWQRFSSNKTNVQFSGANTLQLVPLRDATTPKGWTSARIESKYTLTPPAGKITRVESSLRLGSNLKKNKQGIWPAFWMLGDSYRKGTIWPACGEIDIMENVNGENVGWGVTHCDKSPGGICNENNGIGATTSLSDDKFHVWRVEFNRKSNDFKLQTITWFMDGKQFHKITGSQIGNTKVWASLAQSPLYFILNVAVGGNWVGSPFTKVILEANILMLSQPGAPNVDTLGGLGSMLEVGYVAHYVSV